MNYAFIPQRFELGLNYTLSMGKNSSPLIFQNGTGPVAHDRPANKFAFQPVPGCEHHVPAAGGECEIHGRSGLVHSLGWTGAVSLRLRYAWERNSVTNWNNDLMQPYMYQTLMQSQVAYYQAMAGNNPNYNVHMLGGTVAWAW